MVDGTVMSMTLSKTQQYTATRVGPCCFRKAAVEGIDDAVGNVAAIASTCVRSRLFETTDADNSKFIAEPRLVRWLLALISFWLQHRGLRVSSRQGRLLLFCFNIRRRQLASGLLFNIVDDACELVARS